MESTKPYQILNFFSPNEKERKKEWLEECFQELERPLILYAYQIVKNREEARDLVQETFPSPFQAGGSN